VEAASGPTEIAEGLPRPDAERSGAPRLLPPPGRQVKGYIRLEDGAADVQALALAWASVLVGALAWASGVPPALVRAEWREPPSDADAVGVIDIRVPDGDP